MRIEHIAFDLDGTLVDTRDQIVGAILSCIPPELRNAAIEAELLASAYQSPKALLGRFGIRSLDEYWKHHARAVHLSRPIAENVSAIIAKLREMKVSVSLVTSLPSRPALTLLDHHGLSDAFSLIDTYASRPNRKPSPALLRAHLADLGVECANAAYVGDSANDMKMARSASVLAWGVGWSPIGASALSDAGADWIIESLGEIPEIIRKRQRGDS